ncbi:hypothetical protein [Rhodovulum steppense]|uniref:Uncharacterized protein n=1 Tax=Rhodovulum steppense TaxID=540251 RepID=A0A4R1YIT4_9RHOB|nr:hypothetical protein [Rhodovulum steppense]TCM76378.1 hypothetical protein EV216_1346 [Rhodovulum steppense]
MLHFKPEHAVPMSSGSARTLLHEFVETHGDALRCAALLLSGRPGPRLVDDLAERLTREPIPGRKTLQAAGRLLALLSLENVHDDEGVEAGVFARLDPAEPYVEEICVLTDGFRDALRAVGQGSARGASYGTAA